MPDPDKLAAVRRALAQVDPTGIPTRGRRFALGVGTLDVALGGGLSLGAIHEMAPAATNDIGAAIGFVIAMAARATAEQPLLWILQDVAAFEAGGLYGPGIDLFGVAMTRLVVLRVSHTRDAYWAMEEALKSGAVATVVAELAKNGGDELTATRRLALAAADSGTIGFLLRHRPMTAASAAPTRWEIAAAASTPDAFGGLGRTTLALRLVKNRHGPTGLWHVTWDHHERSFAAAFSRGVAATTRDRSDRAPSLARTA
jgi:protein ImuA